MNPFFFFFFFLVFIGYNSLQHAYANGEVECVDLADFFYEIIMGVSAFPNQGDCSEREEAEIAAFLQEEINKELDSLPGTIKTDNKVCSNPINSHRRLFANNNNNNKTKTSESFLWSFLDTNKNNRELTLRLGRRSFIYVGGGRCRFCFYDNFDARRDLLSSSSLTSLHAKHDLNHNAIQQQERHLIMYTISMRPPSYHLPKVSDIALCKKSITGPFIASYDVPFPAKEQNIVKWSNAKRMTMNDNKDKNYIGHDTKIMGMYAAGERFGVQGHTKDIMRGQNQVEAAIAKTIFRGAPVVLFKLPVKGGLLSFRFWAFDLPNPVNPMADFPFYLYINGVKLDFNLLVSQPGTQIHRSGRNKQQQVRAQGTSFAGIEWSITLKKHGDFAFGPRPDRMYRFHIRAPLILFLHKNQMDIDFIIKPTAKANYAFNRLTASLVSAQCNVTEGLDESPFDDFKSVVESRLFHKLGVGLAHKFQNKKGHCMFDKIPVVDVHLVEKQSWKESNPQC